MKFFKGKFAKYFLATICLMTLFLIVGIVLPTASPETLLRKPVMQVDCVDNYDKPIGSFKISSSDHGMTAILESEGKSTTLNFLGENSRSEEYGNGNGEKLMFDGEIWISNIFGNKSGVCGLS